MLEEPKTSTLISEVNWFLADLREALPGIFRDHRSAKGSSRTRRIPFQGRTLELQIQRDCTIGRSTIRADGDVLVLGRSAEDPRPPVMVLEEWYREEAKDFLYERVRHWAEQIGVQYRRMAIKDQRTLWGSCSKDGNLNFNWRLVMAPAEVLDYVVVHELAHLLEMNHSKRFWAVVTRQCPDHKAHRRWLREHSRDLRSSRGLK